MRYFIIALMLCSSACAHKQTFKNLDAWNEKPNESINLSIRTIKRKGIKVDLMVVVRNNYPFMVVIPQNSIRLEINGDHGTSEGNPRWVLNQGDSASSLLKFKLDESEDGIAKITLQNINKGNETLVNGIDSNTDEMSGGIAGRHVFIGKSSSTTKSEGYVKKSAIEGDALPSVSLEVPE